METRRIFIVGDTIFAEALVELLAADDTIQLSGTATNLDNAIPQLGTCHPDAVIVASVNRMPDSDFARFLVDCPEISILCTDLGTNDVQIVFNQRVSVHNISDLLAIIAALPKRG